ncbi:hypothetical protein CbC4_5092 (plasmid) [Clostridium botulinum BKT015925]|nr:hypothetical protein CbC4_5092 [Clostridium botulinum BKT015925]KEH96094.1 hypothetical protein Y848_p0090 [Clostridium botulinum C/D str. Sp77]
MLVIKSEGVIEIGDNNFGINRTMLVIKVSKSMLDLGPEWLGINRTMLVIKLSFISPLLLKVIVLIELC